MPEVKELHRNAVKFIDSSKERIEGYLVRFTSAEEPDLWDEYFERDTDLGFGRYQTMPLLYQHGLDSVLKTSLVGIIDTMRVDDVGLHVEAILADALKTQAPGLWSEAQVEMYEDYIAEIKWLIEQGYLGWSSGALPTSVIVGDDGKIKRWHVVEGSLTPTPAEPKTMGDVTFKRSPKIREVGGGLVYVSDPAETVKAYKALSLPDLKQLEADSAIESAPAGEQDGQGDNASHEASTNARDMSSNEEAEMPEATPTIDIDIQEQVNEAVQAALAAQAEAQKQAELEAKAARAEELEQRLAELEEQVAEKQDEQRQPAKRLPGRESELEMPDNGNGRTPAIKVTSPYDDLTAMDMVHGYMLFKGVSAPLSDEYHKAMGDKVIAEQLGLPEKYRGMKSDELVHSTQTGYGDEWVPDAWSNMLWEEARLNNTVLPLFRSVDMPANPYELPVESADPTVYFVPETTEETQLTLSGSGAAIPDSKVGSAKTTLTAKKLALRVGFSAEFVEDSIIPALPQLREQSVRAMRDAIDNVLLNGDTTDNYPTAENINSEGADPANTAKFLAFNGLRHLPLVVTTANAVDASGVPTLSLIRQARFTMAGKYSVNPNNLAIICDASTYAKLLSLDEVITIDKFGPRATVMNGQLAAIDGMPVLVSAEMGLTHTSGMIHDTTNNNVKGQIVIVYRPGWTVGHRRRVTATVKFYPEWDAYQLVATVRLALTNRDTDVAAMLYNLTV